MGNAQKTNVPKPQMDNAHALQTYLKVQRGNRDTRQFYTDATVALASIREAPHHHETTIDYLKDLETKLVQETLGPTTRIADLERRVRGELGLGWTLAAQVEEKEANDQPSIFFKQNASGLIANVDRYFPLRCPPKQQTDVTITVRGHYSQ